MLEMDNIKKVYRTDLIETHALEDFSLHVRPGEFVAVMGPSGSGKTTFLNVAGLLDTFGSGTYVLDGNAEFAGTLIGGKGMRPTSRVNDRVPLATVGAVLDIEFVVTKRAMRGIESYGMLCSEKELGITDDHTGIFILPDTISPGTVIAESPIAFDTVLDVSVPPNRGDCLSVFGIAREVASILRQRAKLPVFTQNAGSDENVEAKAGLAIEDTAACPRYVLKLIKGISIRQSPFWMRRRITRCGMRPINNIVDVTNYVMLHRRRRAEYALGGKGRLHR